MKKVRNLISILMDSPLYLTLALKERHALIMTMAQNYPFLVETDTRQTGPGYESIGNEGIQTL
ncbi:MAG TPA: hypothetical protein VEI46_02340 [Thermodesulfovibrionales bacterium]|nr:hypothetical protein [Thermodesulfovibrionales bacterium]